MRAFWKWFFDHVSEKQFGAIMLSLEFLIVFGIWDFFIGRKRFRSGRRYLILCAIGAMVLWAMWQH